MYIKISMNQNYWSDLLLSYIAEQVDETVELSTNTRITGSFIKLTPHSSSTTASSNHDQLIKHSEWTYEPGSLSCRSFWPEESGATFRYNSLLITETSSYNSDIVMIVLYNRRACMVSSKGH